MTRDIYWVVALAFGFILLLVLCREKNRIKDDFGGVTRAFFFLGIASFIYCLLDMLWGLCYSHVINNETALFVCSSVFFIVSVFTLMSWLYFVLKYVKCKKQCLTVFLGLYGAIAVAQTALVIYNIFDNVMFSVVNGEYVRGTFGSIAFISHFGVYVIMVLCMLVAIFRNGFRYKEFKGKFGAVFIASAVPLFLGLLQYKYPEAPFDSMGISLSCLTLYIYAVSVDRERLTQGKNVFLQNMGHEIRTTLNSVYGFAQLLSLPDGTWTDEERKAYAKHINDSYNMLDMLLNDLMVSTRYDTHNYSIEIKPMNVRVVCEDAIQALEICRPASVELKMVSTLPEGFTIESDGRRIRQVLQNMLTNACQFVSKGVIELNVSLQDDDLVFMVTDNVPRINNKLNDKTPAELHNNRMEGLGLRLQICEVMARKLGGSMYKGVDYTKGTRYIFSIKTK